MHHPQPGAYWKGQLAQELRSLLTGSQPSVASKTFRNPS